MQSCPCLVHVLTSTPRCQPGKQKCLLCVKYGNDIKKLDVMSIAVVGEAKRVYDSKCPCVKEEDKRAQDAVMWDSCCRLTTRSFPCHLVGATCQREGSDVHSVKCRRSVYEDRRDGVRSSRMESFCPCWVACFETIMLGI